MNRILNNRGPLYLVEYGKKEYIVIPSDSEKEGKGWWVLDQDGDLFHEYKFMNKLGVDIIGLGFDQLLNIFFDENETINKSDLTESQRGNIKTFIIDKIENGELIEAAKLVGGYPRLLKLIGDYEIDNRDKGFIIMTYVKRFGQQVINPENRINISKYEEDSKLIYHLNKYTASVAVFKNGGYNNDYSIAYGFLDGDILDEIISVLVDNKTKESY
jgi:hypothetical protein